VLGIRIWRKPEAAFMDDMARGKEKASIYSSTYLYQKASVLGEGWPIHSFLTL
jgi:hypothetical protein